MALKVAVLGGGVVGSQVIRIIEQQGEDLAARIGAQLEISAVLVRDLDAERDYPIPAELLTTDTDKALEGADLVVELMGGTGLARELINKAISQGASVITANKALLASHGPELYEAAGKADVDLFYEASVAGAIPIIRPIRESLAGDRIQKVMGIVNGTTNFVLDEMTTKGLDFDEVVAEAQRLGYAEADPTADVGGHDAAAKASILASLAFHTTVQLEDVHCEGITEVSADDVAWAKRSGLVIKLLAVVERVGEGIIARVHPTLVPKEHPLAGVRGAFNAVFVETAEAGELMFYGQGAGGAPTASAVLGDIVRAARNKAVGNTGPRELNYAKLPVLDISKARTKYQVRLLVDDQPGVLAQISATLADQNVSIEQMQQRPSDSSENLAELLILTHHAPEANLAQTTAAIGQLPVVQEVVSVLRVEGN